MTDNHDYSFKISSFDVGPMEKIKASSILKYQIEAGERHLSEKFGLDYDTVKQNNCVFVIINLTVKINRMPKVSENITINTWNKRIKGLRFYRGYDWIDEKGEKAIEGISSFVLVSATEHKLEKPDALGIELPCSDNRESNVEIKNKIRMPDGMQTVGKRQVLYSLLDCNDHLNNSFYADFVMDFVEKEVADNFSELSIDFVKEALLGDEIIIKTKKENNMTYMLGEVDGNCCFRASVK